MKHIAITIATLLLGVVTIADGQSLFNPDRIAYIERYKDIAVREMHRTGIPASIKLAQAILESGIGKSDLAQQANNHFGIKCGSNWEGRTFEKKDDDRNAIGMLVKSCFRAYDNPEQSFMDHSDFLTNPEKSGRYGFLFDLDRLDYKGWAHGLKKAGYATNAKYPALLIGVIEENFLHQYDFFTLEDLEDRPVIVVDDAPTPMPVVDELPPVTADDRLKDEDQPDQGEAAPEYVNDVRVMVVKEGETLAQLARRADLSVDRLLDYNEVGGEWQPVAGAIVFLQPKRNSFRGRTNHHTVEAGETMHSISQRYGMKVERLCRRNLMEVGQEPKVGEIVFLRGKRPTPIGLRVTTPPVRSRGDELPPISPSDDRGEAAQGLEHTVQAGETLYAIARKYGLTVGELMALNGLKETTVHLGQVLKVKK